MSDTPSNNTHARLAWLIPLIMACLKYVVPSVLAFFAARADIVPAVQSVKIGAHNIGEQNASEIAYLLKRDDWLTAKVNWLLKENEALNILLESRQ